MNTFIPLLLLVGCTQIEEHDEVVVDASGWHGAKVVVAGSEGFELDHVDWYPRLVTYPCDDEERGRIRDSGPHLLGEAFRLDHGRWCDVSIQSEQELVVRGRAPEGAFEIEIPVWSIPLVSGHAWEMPHPADWRRGVVAEVGGEGWLEVLRPHLGSETLRIDSVHPLWGTLLREIHRTSGLYEDVDLDGLLTEAERAPLSAPAVVTPTSMLVAVGSEPYVWVSRDDGRSFSRQWVWNTFGNLPRMRDVAWGDGRGVLVGSGHPRAVATSEDGANWYLVAVDGAPLRGVTHAEGRFVAVGELGTVSWSTDGLAWHDVQLPVQTTWTDVVHGDGRFVAVGEGGSHAWSDDGVAWEVDAWGDADLLAVTWGADRFVAVGADGARHHSDDGAHWLVAEDDPFTLSSVVWDGAHFVAVGDGEMRASPDGVAWGRMAWSELTQVVVAADGALVGVASHDRIVAENDTEWTVLGESDTTIRKIRRFDLGD